MTQGGDCGRGRGGRGQTLRSKGERRGWKAGSAGEYRGSLNAGAQRAISVVQWLRFRRTSGGIRVSGCGGVEPPIVPAFASNASFSSFSSVCMCSSLLRRSLRSPPYVLRTDVSERGSVGGGPACLPVSQSPKRGLRGMEKERREWGLRASERAQRRRGRTSGTRGGTISELGENKAMCRDSEEQR